MGAAFVERERRVVLLHSIDDVKGRTSRILVSRYESLSEGQDVSHLPLKPSTAVVKLSEVSLHEYYGVYDRDFYALHWR